MVFAAPKVAGVFALPMVAANKSGCIRFETPPSASFGAIEKNAGYHRSLCLQIGWLVMTPKLDSF